jgi:hypothetical protein
LEPTKLSTLKLNKTLPQAVSVKPQVDLYKGLNPAIVPDVPASYIQQPDRAFQTLVAQPDRFHKYQTTQRDAEESVGFFLDQELKREMAETNLNPYMYSRKQTKAENELNRLINQPTRRLTPQEIFALENRILGEDPRLLPDYASLSYIARHSALLDFIRDRKIFTNMTAWKTSFMNVLNNTFARLRINKPEWLNTVLADNGKDPLLTPGVDLGARFMSAEAGIPQMSAGTGHPPEPTQPSRRVERTPTGERTIVHDPPTAPVAPSMVTPPVPVPVQPPVQTAPTAPTPQPVFSVTAGGPPDPSAPGVGNRSVEDFVAGVGHGVQSGLEAAARIFEPTGQPVQVDPREQSGQQSILDYLRTPATGAAAVVSSRPIDVAYNGFSNGIINAIQGDRTSNTDRKLMEYADLAKANGIDSSIVHEAAAATGRANIPTPDVFDAIAYLKTLYQDILEILTRDGGHLNLVRRVLTQLDRYEGKKKNP